MRPDAVVIGDYLLTRDRRRWRVIQIDRWRGQSFVIAQLVNGVALFSTEVANLHWQTGVQAWAMRPDEP